jgi:hypothetical protein
MVANPACPIFPQLVRNLACPLVHNYFGRHPDKRTSTENKGFSLSGVLVRNCLGLAFRTSTENLLVRLSLIGRAAFRTSGLPTRPASLGGLAA